MSVLAVTAIIVTRSIKEMDTDKITDTIPFENGWQALIWDNGAGQLLERYGTRWTPIVENLPDLAVYGRYAALDYADNELVYVQDDDVVVSDPAMIALAANALRFGDGSLIDAVVCNMPQEFRHSFYEEHALTGFGCCFPRTLPGRIFDWFKEHAEIEEGLFNRTCDIIFTALAKRMTVDVPIQSLAYAHDSHRMWKQPEHQSERSNVLTQVKQLAIIHQKSLREGW